MKNLPEIKHVRDIIWYDGPMMAEFKDKSENSYVVNWADCDFDKNINIWVVIKSTREEIELLEKDKISIDDLAMKNDVWICEQPHDKGLGAGKYVADKDKLRAFGYEVDNG